MVKGNYDFKRSTASLEIWSIKIITLIIMVSLLPVEDAELKFGIGTYLILVTMDMLMIYSYYIKRDKSYYRDKIHRDLKDFIEFSSKTRKYRIKKVLKVKTARDKVNNEKKEGQTQENTPDEYEEVKELRDYLKINYKYVVENGYLHLRFDTRSNTEFFDYDDNSLTKQDFEKYFRRRVEFNYPDYDAGKSYYEVILIKKY